MVSELKQHNMERSYPPAFWSWVVWGLGAAFYLTGFYQRVAPAVMTDQLMADFHIGAAALGNLSAYYFYSYVAIQIPTGILADVWGPRKLLGIGSCIAALGAFLFAVAPTILVANIGRLLIGGSVGVAWVGLLKLSMHWFPPHRFAMTSGLALCCGLVGAVSAGVPLRILVEHFTWRPVMLVSAVGSVAIAIALWVLVRDDPSERGYTGYMDVNHKPSHELSSILRGVGKVFTYRNTWILSIAPSGIVGAVLSFSGLWGVPFLTTHYNMSQARSAALCSLLLVAWGLAGPVFGALSDRIRRRKPFYVAGAFISFALWCIILFIPNLPTPAADTPHFHGRCSLRGHDPQFCICKRVRPPVFGRHRIRRRQHGCHDGPHDPAAPDGMDSGPEVGRKSAGGHSNIQFISLSVGLYSHGRLVVVLRGAHMHFQGNPMSADGLSIPRT